MHFATRIVSWQRQHGRHDLPWQNTTDPYKIWLSEIMLQQTQVATVIGYFERFLGRFPDLASLAAATQDEVMPYWAGLGYYARARNLHKCAQTLVRDWNGRFPPDAAQITTLPGIGPSTAAAIAAFSYGERAPIMDGNVKRVFTRHFGIEGAPTRKDVERTLWSIAHNEVDTAALGQIDMPAYTQGLMDLGATLCTRRQPSCDRCPVQTSCFAARENQQHVLPTPRLRKVSPEREVAMLVMIHEDSILLTLRPSPGIWGGLWSLPECAADETPTHTAQSYGVIGSPPVAMAAFLHVFTHFRLTIRPWHITVSAHTEAPPAMRWFKHQEVASLGLPAPIRKLLDGLLVQDMASTSI